MENGSSPLEKQFLVLIRLLGNPARPEGPYKIAPSILAHRLGEAVGDPKGLRLWGSRVH